MKTNTISVKEEQNGILITCHQMDKDLERHFGRNEVELFLKIPQPSISELQKKLGLSSKGKLLSWIKKQVYGDDSLYPLKEYLDKLLIQYEWFIY